MRLRQDSEAKGMLWRTSVCRGELAGLLPRRKHLGRKYPSRAAACSMPAWKFLARKAWLMGAVLVLCGCGSGTHLQTFTTTVDALSTEDLSGPCRYDLAIPADTVEQAGVLVIFERGDSRLVYEDMRIRELTFDLHLASVFAYECNAKSYGDLQSDASKGPARALTTALAQLAVTSRRPELATAPVYLYGFSAAGALSMTMAEALPDRIAGAISYAAGSAYLNIEDLRISSQTARVPMLMMANAQDQIVGTFRNKKYFERGRTLDAPWAYAVQNNTGHCCNESTLNLVLPWVRAIATGQGAAAGTMMSFSCVPDGVADSYGTIDCSFVSPDIGVAGGSAKESGWLPDPVSARAWFGWVTSRSTN